MTDKKKEPFGDPYFWSSDVSLHLGTIYDYDLAQFVVASIRSVALQTTDQRLTEYALKLMLEVKKWKDIVVAEEEAKAKAEEKAQAAASRTHL